MPLHKFRVHNAAFILTHICGKPDCRPYHQMCDFRSERVRMVIQTYLVVSYSPVNGVLGGGICTRVGVGGLRMCNRWVWPVEFFRQNEFLNGGV